MLASPEFFYGSTVTLLDSTGAATYSPYWYRSADSLLTTDLVADTAYNINQQTWLRQPIDGGAAIWTAPYFDTGGGNIWMKTRAVPVIINGKIIAIATWDHNWLSIERFIISSPYFSKRIVIVKKPLLSVIKIIQKESNGIENSFKIIKNVFLFCFRYVI